MLKEMTTTSAGAHTSATLITGDYLVQIEGSGI